MGKNKDFIYSKLPHINDIIEEDLEIFLDSIELLVIVNKDRHIEKLKELINNNICIVDFVGIDLKTNETNYEGICW